MNKTIKELADALGVSKTAVRKYMTEEFRCEHTETNRNGVITIDSDGCKLIAMHLGRTEKLAESTENKIPEAEKTTENPENLVIPRVVWDALQEQLKVKDLQIEEKDRQLAAKDQQILNLTQLADHAQKLHAGSLQQLLPDGEPAAAVDVESAPEEQPRKRKWAWPWEK